MGTILVLGVAVLDAHAALPEHHHAGGTETLCIASLAIATLAIAAWALGSVNRRTRVIALRPRSGRSPVAFRSSRTPSRLARAGPGPPVVLRR